MSGPRPDSAATSFSAANSAATDATFTAAGTYTLTLTVSDGTLTDSDTLTVTVADAPPPTADVFPADDDDTDPSSMAGPRSMHRLSAWISHGSGRARQPRKAVPAGANAGNGMIVRHGQLVHFWGDIDQTLRR